MAKKPTQGAEEFDISGGNDFENDSDCFKLPGFNMNLNTMSAKIADPKLCMESQVAGPSDVLTMPTPTIRNQQTNAEVIYVAPDGVNQHDGITQQDLLMASLSRPAEHARMNILGLSSKLTLLTLIFLIY